MAIRVRLVTLILFFFNLIMINQASTTLISEGITELEKYNKALEGNRNYVSKKLAQDPDYFKKLAKGQNPKYLLIGCSDSRAPPNELTETDPGEIFIHRNIANLVVPTDLNINCVIQYAVEHLKVHNVIIMGHTCCGGVKAAMDQASVGGLLDLWLNQIKMVYEKHQSFIDPIPDPTDRLNSLCSLNVREQVLNIWRNPIIQKSWQSGHPVMVHGWLFRVETGFIEEVSVDQSIPDELSKIFQLKFNKDLPHKMSVPSSPVSAPVRRFQRMQSRIEQGIKDHDPNIQQYHLDSDDEPIQHDQQEQNK